jgi:hypothetical protein
MKLYSLIPFAVAHCLLQTASISATESSDGINVPSKNLRRLGTGERPITGAKKEKKIKGDAETKEKLPPKKKDAEKNMEKGVKGESIGKEGGKVKVPKTKAPKESTTPEPSDFMESDVPSDISSFSPSIVPL